MIYGHGVKSQGSVKNEQMDESCPYPIPSECAPLKQYLCDGIQDSFYDVMEPRIFFAFENDPYPVCDRDHKR